MSLASLILSRFRNYPGGIEHRQVVGLLSGAKGYELDPDTVTLLVDTLSKETASIERNVDVILPPDRPIWVEFDNAPRLAAGAYHSEEENTPERIGYLFASDPASNDIVMMSAWTMRSKDGDLLAAHSMSFARFDAERLSHAAWQARRSDRTASLATIERLANLATIMTPPNFQAEVEIAVGEQNVASALLMIRKDLVSEVPFALACFLLLSSGNAVIEGDENIQKVRVRHQTSNESTLGRRIGRMLGRRDPRGFVRTKPFEARAITLAVQASA